MKKSDTSNSKREPDINFLACCVYSDRACVIVLKISIPVSVYSF